MAELDSDRRAEVVIDTRLDPTGAPIVIVSGELDISTAPSLEAIVASLTAEHPERLIFDLSDLRFMDSAGIAVLKVQARFDNPAALDALLDRIA